MKRTSKISDEDKALFRTYIKDVRPLPKTSQALFKRQQTPLPHRSVTQQEPDYNAIFTDALQLPLVQSQEKLAFCRSGLTQPFFRQLQRGQFSPVATLTLRHLTVAEARQALGDFLDIHCQQGTRCLKIIHGKGQSSAAQPVLKNYLNHWLRQYSAVLAFCSAKLNDGGAGAVYVLLQARKKQEK